MDGYGEERRGRGAGGDGGVMCSFLFELWDSRKTMPTKP